MQNQMTQFCIVNNPLVTYYNASSLLLKSNMSKPDCVCIVESWLSPDIQDGELMDMILFGLTE